MRSALCRALIATALLVGMTPLSAHAGGDTKIEETFVTAHTEISPGLCAPGDTADCVGPEVGQFRVWLSEASTCRLVGIFEGQTLPDGATCGFELYGFMVGTAPGSKPACGGARIYTSDETTAFGEGRKNLFWFNGVPRSIHIEGETFGALAVFTKVEADDDDADLDPTGDHINLALPTPIRREADGSGVPCVSTPLTKGTLLFGGGLWL